jgi:hypothetical protein
MSMTQADMAAAYRTVWSLFIAIEAGNDEQIEAICRETDEATLLRGWHVVAARLRLALGQHAEAHGCDCGSSQWLERERLNLAARGEETGGGR